MPKPWTWQKPKPIPTWQAQLRKPVHWQALPEVTPAQRQAADIERLIDLVMAVDGLEGPQERYDRYEDIRALVVEELSARALGRAQAYTLVVRPAPSYDLLGVPYHPRYTADPPDTDTQGCTHEVTAGSANFAAIRAISDHWRCIGR